MITDTSGKLAGIIMVILAYMGMLTCVIRTDFNFALGIFCYLTWVVDNEVKVTMKPLVFYLHL